MPSEIIRSLSAASKERIGAVRRELSNRLPPTLPADLNSKVAIFATGSLARGEANQYSDLDAFFYILGSQDRDKVEPVTEITTFNHVIETTKCTGFPDFSGGGEYLHFQYLDDVVANIGSRQDDYINGLTSRMLLILESSYLYNEEQFLAAKEKVIDRYFVDFHDHSADFRPIFILNDVLRFWRTLCLNYEHGREWRKDDPRDRSKGHLKNLKLRFSRLMICYSFVGALLKEGPALNAKQVLGISTKTPIERLLDIRAISSELDQDIETVLNEYSWFLDAMNAEKDEVLNWMLDDYERTEAFAKSKMFIETMYRLIVKIAEVHDYTRYLVI